MEITSEKLGENLTSVRRRITAACERVRRRPEDVCLLAVTKSVDVDTVKELISLGQTNLGESRVQQLTERVGRLEQWLADRPANRPTIRWHMVGHLQRNKVKACTGAAEMIHSIDSLRLAEEISARAERQGRRIECLMEVNCASESQKTGVAVGAATHLAEQICTLSGIRLTGLMTMAPLVADPQKARFAFTRLRELFEEMRNEKIGGKGFRHLSMGMSNDFEVAVEEGATIVRIGTALFE